MHIHVHHIGFVGCPADLVGPQNGDHGAGLPSCDLANLMAAQAIQCEHLIEVVATRLIRDGQLAAPAHQRPIGESRWWEIEKLCARDVEGANCRVAQAGLVERSRAAGAVVARLGLSLQQDHSFAAPGVGI